MVYDGDMGGEDGGMKQFVIEHLDRAAIEREWDAILTVYRRAFGEAPYHRSELHVIDFASSLQRQYERDGFRFRVARWSENGLIAGMAYGYTCLPGQWWFETIARRADPQLVEDWLKGSFELVEFAVLPQYQQRGMGSALHDSILAGLPHRRAVLSTMQADTPAYRMYCKRGWFNLIDSFSFPGVNKNYRIMGRELKPTGSQHPAHL